MSPIKLLILGSSGLTGSNVLKHALEDTRISEVFIWVRKPLGISHPKLKEVIVNFLDYESVETKFPLVDSVCCCIGTTIKKQEVNMLFTKQMLLFPKQSRKLPTKKGLRLLFFNRQLEQIQTPIIFI